MGEDEGLESLEQLRSVGASPPTPTMGTGLGWCLVGYQFWGHSLHPLGPLSAPPEGAVRASPALSPQGPRGLRGLPGPLGPPGDRVSLPAPWGISPGGNGPPPEARWPPECLGCTV